MRITDFIKKDFNIKTYFPNTEMLTKKVTPLFDRSGLLQWKDSYLDVFHGPVIVCADGNQKFLASKILCAQEIYCYLNNYVGCHVRAFRIGCEAKADIDNVDKIAGTDNMIVFLATRNEDEWKKIKDIKDIDAPITPDEIYDECANTGTWKERLLEEYMQLLGRTEALIKYEFSDEYETLPREEQTDLQLQVSIMESYERVLSRRLERNGIKAPIVSSQKAVTSK